MLILGFDNKRVKVENMSACLLKGKGAGGQYHLISEDLY